MNEGFTKYLERKGAEVYLGKDYVPLDEVIGYNDLLEAFNKFGLNSTFSSLSPVFNGKNPDNAFSSVPYEKGYFFLKYIESLIGETNFRIILSSWISKYAFSTVNTNDFK